MNGGWTTADITVTAGSATKSLSVNKSRNAFDPNAIGYAKDGEGRGRPHARVGRQSRRRIGVKPFGNGQIGPIAFVARLALGRHPRLHLASRTRPNPSRSHTCFINGQAL